ncbi:DUF1992 domain-containing protein [Microbacterium karelineae]|uniref:DnaJ family domain-containing protein n=1 Tax=Microbacterium karelineae TaxID=2654283 RepID=UPI0012EAEA38|nr:DUF1992 domain-containing protein [Microbacterium karelineae]
MSDPSSDDGRDLEAEERADGAGGPPSWTTREERWAAVETSIQLAMRRGEFDDLPGAGKPLEWLGGGHDPDWWIRRKVEREGLTGLAPPAIQLRNEHRAMDETLDGFAREDDVRAHLEDFNRRVRHARLQLQGGPPVVTPTHDVDEDVRAWHERRAARAPEPPPEEPRRGWFSWWWRGSAG